MSRPISFTVYEDQSGCISTKLTAEENFGVIRSHQYPSILVQKSFIGFNSDEVLSVNVRKSESGFL